jgi:ArsR family transcriptional regulator, arsenate/arsenite/antimonite-responsive transcriptional repressor
MATPAKTKKPTKSTQDKMNKMLVEIFRSLADENRLQILQLLLTEGRSNVSRICEKVGESQPAISHHLTQLKHANLVDFQRDGKFNYYFISSDTLRSLLEHFFPAAVKHQHSVAFGELEISFRIR